MSPLIHENRINENTLQFNYGNRCMTFIVNNGATGYILGWFDLIYYPSYNLCSTFTHDTLTYACSLVCTDVMIT